MPKLSDVQPNLANHIASVNKDSIIHLFNDNISDVSCNEMSSAMRSDSDMDIDNLVWEDDHELYDNPNVYKGSTVEEMHEWNLEMDMAERVGCWLQDDTTGITPKATST